MAPASKQLIRTAGIDVQFLIDAEDSAGSTTAFMARIAPGAHTPPPHLHESWDETVCCTEGVVTYTIDGVKQEVAKGQALFVRRGQVHKFDNVSDSDAWMFVVSTPGLFGEDYFLDIAKILNGAGDGPPDMAALLAIQASHGVTPARPD